MEENELKKEEYIRYARQLSLPGFGLAAQHKLKKAQVLVVGAGGLGIPVLQYLVAAGVGTVGVIDHDTVELSNLHRQVIYSTVDAGKLKVSVAKERLGRLNPEVEIKAYPVKLDKDNAAELFMEFDVIVDGTDNLPTRYLINDQGVACGIPIVYGAIFRYEGQVSVFNIEEDAGRRSPNYRDLFPEQINDRSIPNCAETGVIGVLPGIIGSLQAMEVIKLITGVGTPLAGRLLMADTLTGETRILKYKSRGKSIDPEKDHQKVQIVPSGSCRSNSAKTNSRVPEITFEELQQWRNENKAFQLIDIREPWEPEDERLNGQRIPMYQLLESHEELSHDKPVVLYCQQGQRSVQAARYLQQNHQFSNIYSLKGGVQSMDKGQMTRDS